MKNKNNGKQSILSKMSDRDKKLLSVVGSAAVIAASGLAVSNSYTKNSQLAEEYKTIKTELDSKQAKISQKKALNSQLIKLNSDTLTKAKKYYGTTNQGEFIDLIDNFVKESGIKFKSVNYTETTDLDFPKDSVVTVPSTTDSKSGNSTTPSASTVSSNSKTNSSGSTTTTTSSSSGATSSSSSSTTSSSGTTSSSSADTNSSSSSSTSSTTTTDDPANRYANTNIDQMTADIEFEGTYTQVLKLLNMIDHNQQTIVSSELELGSVQSKSDVEEQTDPVVSGKIKLRFYQVKDVERYAPKPESLVDKTPIPFANLKSPFMVPTWLANSSKVASSGGTDSTGTNNNNLGNATSTTNSTSGDFSPSYLNQLGSASNGGSSLSAYYNSSTIYGFDSPLKLVRSGSSDSTDVTVDNADFLEGSGSNVVKIPATKSTTLFEMQFAAPYVTLNSQPDQINFSLNLSSKWQGKIGLIVKNSSGQKIYLHLIRPNDWTGWREVGFNPANVPGFSYPMTILGYYFETPSGESPETTMKIDNLSVSNLVTN